MSHIRLRPIIFITAAVLCFSISVSAVELDLTVKAALLMDAHSGQIFYEKDIDEPLPIASISKLMTLVLVLEALDAEKIALSDVVTTSDYAASMGIPGLAGTRRTANSPGAAVCDSGRFGK